MAEALVSPVVEQLVSIMARELEQKVRLVVGVENAVDQLTSNLTAIKAVLADAEIRQVKEATVRDWLEKLRDVAYDIEDVLDDWEAAILSSQSKPGDEQDPKKPERKVCSFLRSSCFCCKQIGQRHDIARKIKELNERLDRIAHERDRYHFDERENNPPIIERTMTTSLIDITEVKGRKEDKDVLIKKLLSEPSDGDGSDPRVLSIVGMGGIGKTTLAQFALNDDRVNDHFDTKIWVCVSDPFNETRVAKAILESLSGSTPNVTELESLLQQIRESIKEKKILLIMDDVWEEDPRKWYQLKPPLNSASSKSKILVTTRKRKVALIMGCSNNNILKVGKLSDKECWSIVSKITFMGCSDTQGKNNLEKIFGKEISKKCRGLPLAAKALGGILQFRQTREEWQSILSSKVWELEEAQRDVIAPLWLSYYDLSPALKRCFSYCAVFPKDSGICKRKLIELWMAQGYLKQRQSDDLEITGENYFQNLAMRSFCQDFTYDDDNKRILSCKMHDIVHDLAQIVAWNECLGVEVNGPAESIIRSASSSNVRHLLLKCTNSTLSFHSFDSAKKLRSLLITGSWNNKWPLTTEELSRLFSESTHVRSLSLRDGYFAEIPPSIRKLVQLRWLDLSRNGKLKQLPETLCELHSLQTIDVSYCDQLKQLPLGIGKLINLRHLHNLGGPARLPKGIGQLTGLWTLEMVDVGGDGDAFSLGGLKNLCQLRGSLRIRNLGKYNCHVGEAEQAELKKKEHVTYLFLSFSRRSLNTEIEGEERWTPRNEELLLEALEPSPNLEILEIEYYEGTTFPGWMISLMNLRFIQLFDCGLCEQLPLLGMLPSLETLLLECIWGVKKVGLELLGIETQIGDSKSEISSSSSSSSPVVVAFPKLTELKFKSMFSWEEWEDYYDGTTKPPPIIIMPSLRSLFIYDCRRLKALPDYILQSTTLHTLEIRACHLLKERYNKEKGEDCSKISHISVVEIEH